MKRHILVNSRSLVMLITAVLLGTATFSGNAFAKGKPPGTPGGKPGGETAAQNLSVPAILVGSLGTLVCGASVAAPSALVPPTGTPLTGYEVPGDYWVQKVHTWQAQCFNAPTASAFGNWGDNLEGDARLKTGSPIRVELVLTNMGIYASPQTLQGYNVIKLEPSELDRLSAYGHDASLAPVQFGQAQWLVHDAGITFSVLNTDTGLYAVPPGTSPTAEINATGKVVYGYNLRVGAPGAYRIQFTTTPAVTLTGVDAGGLIDANNVYIDIDVVAGGGQGGGKPNR
jgi:hypothetical protein